MKTLKKLYYKIFPHYRYLEQVFVSYEQASKLLDSGNGWELDTKYEDTNTIYNRVYLCRRERIVS